jgi:hypothetical protein
MSIAMNRLNKFVCDAFFSGMVVDIIYIPQTLISVQTYGL